MGHTFVLVDEETVGFDGDLLLQRHAVVLKILQRMLSVVETLHQGVH